MDRRNFLARSTTALATISTSTFSPIIYAGTIENTINSFNILAELRSTQLFRNTALPVSTDPNAAQNKYGSCFLTQTGGYLNWYFNNIAINAFIKILSQNDVKSYLISYISNLTIPANSSVQPASTNGYRAIDIVFTYPQNPSDPGTPSYRTYVDPFDHKTYYSSDSDDSYAATFLTLFANYMRIYNDTAFLNQNISTLINIGIFNIIRSYKSSSMMTSTYRTDSAIGPSKYGQISFTMDNCEVYQGIKDLIYLMQKSTAFDNSTNINIFTTYLNYISQGIFLRYQVDTVDNKSKFLPSDDLTYNQFSPGNDTNHYSTIFYPGRSSQVFPQAFDVPDYTSSTTTTKYNNAWSFLFSSSDWAYCTANPFPWMIVGFVAAKRGATTPGEYTNAKIQMNAMISAYNTNKSIGTINELGYFQRTKELLISAGQL